MSLNQPAYPYVPTNNPYYTANVVRATQLLLDGQQVPHDEFSRFVRAEAGMQYLRIVEGWRKAAER